MKAIYKGGQFQTGDFAQILTGIYRRSGFLKGEERDLENHQRETNTRRRSTISRGLLEIRHL
jgi:hypothetical protein